MKRFVALCLLALPGCSSAPEVATTPTPAAPVALVPAATPAGVIATLPPPTPVPTADPKATLAPTPQAAAPVAVVAPAPSQPKTVAAIVGDAFDAIESATTTDQIVAIRGDLATTTLNLDQEMRRAQIGSDSSRPAIIARAQNAVDLALAAANSKYNILQGTGDTVTLNHNLEQRSVALRFANDADAMIADPTRFERQNAAAAEGMRNIINSDAERLGRR